MPENRNTPPASKGPELARFMEGSAEANLMRERDSLLAQRDALAAALLGCLDALDGLAWEAGDVATFNEGGDGYESCKAARAALALIEKGA